MIITLLYLPTSPFSDYFDHNRSKANLRSLHFATLRHTKWIRQQLNSNSETLCFKSIPSMRNIFSQETTIRQ